MVPSEPVSKNVIVFLSFVVIPVKLGIIGVVNRSQLDITNNKVSENSINVTES